MPSLRPGALTAALALGLVLSTAAQAQQTGIAFSYAPEQGSGMCRGDDAGATIACAVQKCVEDGGTGEECAPVAWCYPSGWSVAVGVLHREGIHWSEYSCGWPSRDAALAAGAVLCDLSQREHIQFCTVAALWDEDGNEIVVEEDE